MEPHGILTADFGKTGRRVARVGLGGEGALRTFGKPEPACGVIRKALDGGITLAIVGCSNASEVEILADAARHFSPLSSSEMADIAALYQPYAEQLAFYRGAI